MGLPVSPLTIDTAVVTTLNGKEIIQTLNIYIGCSTRRFNLELTLQAVHFFVAPRFRQAAQMLKLPRSTSCEAAG